MDELTANTANSVNGGWGGGFSPINVQVQKGYTYLYQPVLILIDKNKLTSSSMNLVS